MYVAGDNFADESSHKTKICIEADMELFIMWNQST